MAQDHEASSAHSTAPWHVELAPNWKPFVTNANREHICTLYAGRNPDRVDANAKFIAAAPELLEACERAYVALCDLSYHPCFRGGSKDFREANETIKALADALNKAHGNP
jgi:hypothetical protein